MSRKPNIAVIGCGYWGPNLVRNFTSLEECCMKVVCDSRTERLKHMENLYPKLETTADVDQIINAPDIDAVAIATPLCTHYPLARRALEAGKHVFVEKPLASSSAECSDLVELAAERGLTLMVGHTFVYTPEVKFIKEMIDAGELGDVYYISSSRLNLGIFQNDINVAWDLAPHDLSIMLNILDEVPASVNCQGGAHMHPHLEDITNISLSFQNGTFATIQSSWLDPIKIRKMTIVGSKGMVVYDDILNQEKIRIYDKRVERPPHYDTFAEFHFSYHYGDMRAPFIRQVEPLKVECQHFLDCMGNGNEPMSSGIDGMRVVQILEACSDSLKHGGRRVEMNYDNKALFEIASKKAVNE